ncbi:uncharacterized protein LOC116346251 [Contarinia nasturtii]|uniref:uncharacterized protein LOC116346251 n=1 Tax=Contarinia nasturtii TaxID=265458 RepID=UPI0012D48CA5|nr:uncharacterized protein LOC116346251 [Contarinia nasturtii]
MAITNALTTFKFNYTISNISEFDEQYTPEVMVQGIPWSVKFIKERVEGEEFFSFYLLCKHEAALRNWSHIAFAAVKLLPFKKNVIPIEYYMAPYIFGSLYQVSGISDFIKWKRLINNRNGFVHDDTIRMEIKIEVADPNDENKSILKIDVLDKCCSHSGHATYRLSVSNIDALMAVGTPEFTLRGLRWKVIICKYMSKWLGFQMQTSNSHLQGTDEVTCNTKANFKLISMKDNAKSIERVLEGQMEKGYLLYDCEFVSWDDLFDDQNGFVRDNAIVLEIKIVAEQPDYTGRNDKKRRSSVDQNEDAKVLKLECSICIEAIHDQDVSSLRCTHMFCTACIRRSMRTYKKCPICNAAAKLTDLRRCRLPIKE